MGREEKITELKNNFEHYVKLFYDNPPPTWEKKLEQYKKVVEKLRSSQERGKLFANDEFLREVYESVKKWVEYRGAKMVEFENFRDSIKENLQILLELVPYKLNELEGKNWEEVKDKIKKGLFTEKNEFKLKVMKGSSQLVGFSKTLHHLLPDLIPPIDREYVLSFCGEAPPWKEPEKFFDVLEVFHSICRNLTENDCRGKWDTSVPKLVDHAIVGFMRKQAQKEKNPGSLKEKIQTFIYEQYIQPAQKQEIKEITIKAGEVHRKMGLKNRVPAVCNALRKLKGREFPGCIVRDVEEKKVGVKKDSSTNEFKLILEFQGTKPT